MNVLNVDRPSALAIAEGRPERNPNEQQTNGSDSSYPNTRSNGTRTAHQISLWFSAGCWSVGYLTLAVALLLSASGGGR